MYKQYLADVTSRAEPLVGASLVYLHCPELAAVAKPGQFVMLRIPRMESYLRLPMPIHRLTEDGIAILFGSTEGSQYLGSLSIGDRLDLLGPCGLTPKITRYNTIALVAQGLGLASLLSFADQASSQVVLLARAASSGQVYPPELVPRQVEYRFFIGEAAEESWRSALAELPTWAQVVFAAGGKPLYTQLIRVFENQVIPLKPGRVYIWSGDHLVCGLGACRGCMVSTKHGQRFVCQDGPFLDLFLQQMS